MITIIIVITIVIKMIINNNLKKKTTLPLLLTLSPITTTATRVCAYRKPETKVLIFIRSLAESVIRPRLRLRMIFKWCDYK